MDMSATINQDKVLGLKKIVEKLHEGASVDSVKRDFTLLIKDSSAEEIAAMEQSLIDGGFPPTEIQRLCDVHVQVFESSLGKGKAPSQMQGHPIQTYMEENRAARLRCIRLLSASRAWVWGIGGKEQAAAGLEDLSAIIIHYTRKENQLFPFLERHGFTAPSKVMWGKHDELRTAFKETQTALSSNPREFLLHAKKLAHSVKRMIFMEERILFPNAMRRLSERDWAQIRAGEEAIGFAWIKPGSAYDAGIALSREKTIQKPDDPAPDSIALGVGSLSPEMLDIVLKRLPLDISVVDENDRVLYYSDTPERVFPRSPGVIGRSVENCHPQKSVAVVKRILEAFKKKEKDSARFWIKLGGKLVVIEYRALYDANGNYKGTLEVSYDATEDRALDGERRLLDWD